MFGLLLSSGSALFSFHFILITLLRLSGDILLRHEGQEPQHCEAVFYLFFQKLIQWTHANNQISLHHSQILFPIYLCLCRLQTCYSVQWQLWLDGDRYSRSSSRLRAPAFAAVTLVWAIMFQSSSTWDDSTWATAWLTDPKIKHGGVNTDVCKLHNRSVSNKKRAEFPQAAVMDEKQVVDQTFRAFWGLLFATGLINSLAADIKIHTCDIKCKFLKYCKIREDIIASNWQCCKTWN